MASVRGVVGLLLALPSVSVMLSSPAALKSGFRGDGHEWTRNQYGEVRQVMKNYYDVQYTGEIKVGGQPIKAIIDTGSFELLAFSVNCSLCGTRPHLYNGAESSHHKTSGFEKMHSYGSGTTDSVESFDDLQIGPLKLFKQVFWEVYSANMDILREDSFASIFGVGPPTSAAKFAEADVAELNEQLKRLTEQGTEITQEMMDIIESYKQQAKHAWHATSVVEHLGLHSLSICMGKQTATNGYVIWNDTAPSRQSKKFLTIDVVGDTYWSANMSSVKLSSSFGDKSEELIGCEDQCSAIIDSGTSLIAAPSDVVERLDHIIQEWAAAGGTCDDLSRLPVLEFSLNGNVLTLPPQSYVGRASGDYDSLIGKTRYATTNAACTSLLMPMDVDSPEGPMWILGMPFFREYYTSFIFRRGKAHDHLQPYAMAFSRASEDCFPGEAPNPDSNLQLRAQKSATSHGAQLNIDASKLIMPTIGHRRSVRNLLPSIKR